jgi:hypothetical protein
MGKGGVVGKMKEIIKRILTRTGGLRLGQRKVKMYRGGILHHRRGL